MENNRLAHIVPEYIMGVHLCTGFLLSSNNIQFGPFVVKQLLNVINNICLDDVIVMLLYKIQRIIVKQF